MKVKLTVATNEVDRQMDKFMPGALTAAANVVLTEGFDKNKALGFADISEENGSMVAEADINEKYLDFYPAIGFRAKDVTVTPEGVRQINEVQLFELSLCVNPNADESIKTIREQLRITATPTTNT